LLAAARATGTALKDQTVVIYGAGSAGSGIGHQLIDMMVDEGLSEEQAEQRFYALDSPGLLLDDRDDLAEFKKPFARPRQDIDDWECENGEQIELIDVVRNAGPTVLLGVSGQGGAFDENVVRTMAAQVDRPII